MLGDGGSRNFLFVVLNVLMKRLLGFLLALFLDPLIEDFDLFVVLLFDLKLIVSLLSDV